MINRYELKMERLRQLSHAARRRFDRATDVNARAVSVSACCVDLFVSIYGESYLGSSKSLPRHPNGDYVLLSRGFAVHALVATLAQCGLTSKIRLGDERLITRDVCWHPGLAPPGVALRSDTLCGLLAIGAELTEDARRRGVCAKAFVVVDASQLDSDSFWNCLRLSAAQQPESVVLVLYQTQASDPISVPSCSGEFDAFGWNVQQIDGHSLTELHDAVHSQPRSTPRVIVANVAARPGDSEVYSDCPSWISTATGTDDGGWVLPNAQRSGAGLGSG